MRAAHASSVAEGVRTDHREGVGQAGAFHVLDGCDSGGLEHARSALTPPVMARLGIRLTSKRQPQSYGHDRQFICCELGARQP